MKIYFPYLESYEKAGGSEQGWAISIANLFSLSGHQVYFGRGNDGWDTFLPEQFDEEHKADVMVLPERLDLWSDKTRWNIHRRCARKFLFGVFHPFTNPEFLIDVPSDSALITPYRSSGSECVVIPYAYYSSKPLPRFSNRTLGWTLRNPFDSGGIAHPPFATHLNHLKSCYELVKKGHKLILFNDHTYPREDLSDYPLIQEACSIITALRNHSRVEVSSHLPYNDYMDLLSKTSVVVPLNGLGSTTEALKIGVVPLSWGSEGNVYSDFPYQESYHRLSYQSIYNKMEKLLTDEEFYKNEYYRLLEKSAVYSLDYGLQSINKVLEKLYG